MQPALFSDYDLVAGLRGERDRARDKIAKLHADIVLTHPLDVLRDEIVAEFGDDELIFLFEEMYATPAEDVDIDISHKPIYTGGTTVPGTRVQIRVPFRGAPNLLQMRASSYTHNPPRAQILDGRIVAHDIEGQSLTASTVKAEIERFQAQLAQQAEWANADIRSSNDRMAQEVTTALEARRTKLLQDRDLQAALPIPIRPRGDQGSLPVPVTRARPRLVDRRPSEPFKPEPEMEKAVYEDVLRVISSTALAFERSPGTFANMAEEELRNHILVVLNGQFDGAATGESFNGAGKTDILLRHADRNAFIGECKIWTGPAAFAEAIEQLRGYLVWRDTKAALVLFIRNRDVTAVIKKARRALADHEACVRAEPAPDESVRSDYVLRSAVDPERLIRVALLPVPMPMPMPASKP
jgi:hypothetical protein